MAGFTDIACNFTHPSFSENLDKVIQDAETVNVKKFVLLCASLKDLEPIRLIQEISKSKFFITSGIHPHHASEIEDLTEALLLQKLKLNNPNAIGETGLDYFRNISSPEAQKRSFEMHISIANELGLPLYLHQRDAHDDFIKILKNHVSPLPNFIVHCFTGTQAHLDDYLDLGGSIGLTGWICDARRNQDLRESIKSIPLERLMIETDCPYLMPRNLPSKPKNNINEPKNLPHIAKEISELMEIDVDKLMQATSKNAANFFS